MSRQEIADVLSTVDGVTGFKFKPTVVDTGDAFPLLESRERGPAQDYENTWNIVVVLPVGDEDASNWHDSHYEAIADALEEYGGCVDRIIPATVETGAGNRDAMILTFRREA